MTIGDALEVICAGFHGPVAPKLRGFFALITGVPV
jgi:hypothetical protein